VLRNPFAGCLFPSVLTRLFSLVHFCLFSPVGTLFSGLLETVCFSFPAGFPQISKQPCFFISQAFSFFSSSMIPEIFRVICLASGIAFSPFKVISYPLQPAGTNYISSLGNDVSFPCSSSSIYVFPFLLMFCTAAAAAGLFASPSDYYLLSIASV